MCFGLAIFSQPQWVKNAELDAFKIKVRECFKGVNWTKQSFISSGVTLESSTGEKTFYSVKEIDKGIEKLDKLLNE